MKEIVLGTISFLLYAVYDLEQGGAISHRFHKITKYFFTIGSVFLAAGTIMLLWKIDVLQMEYGMKRIIFLLFAILFFGLLIYTLFFALPFEETYVMQEAHKTYDKKMYALCRHPGVLWFAGVYFPLFS